MDREYRLLDMQWADKVLPCPRCQTKENLIIQRYDYSAGESFDGGWEAGSTTFHIECVKCHFESEDSHSEPYHPLSIDEEKIVELWNESVSQKLSELNHE